MFEGIGGMEWWFFRVGGCAELPFTQVHADPAPGMLETNYYHELAIAQLMGDKYRPSLLRDHSPYVAVRVGEAAHPGTARRTQRMRANIPRPHVGGRLGDDFVHQLVQQAWQ